MLLPTNTQGKGLGDSLRIASAQRAEPASSEAPSPEGGDRSRLAEVRQRVGLAAVAAANKRSAASQANRVQDGQSLSALRSTSSAPNGVQQRSSGLVRPDGGQPSRSASLFDLPSSGQGLVDRLRAQVRPSSPLNALGSASSSTRSAVTRSVGNQLLAGDDPVGGLSSTRANAQRASLQSSFTRIDNSSRFLLSSTNSARSSGGFGLAAISSSVVNLIG